MYIFIGSTGSESLAEACSANFRCTAWYHAVQRKFAEQASAKLSEPVLPMKIYMKKPWEIIFCEEE